MIIIKSVLGRVRNCVGEQTLRCEMVASSNMYQPNHSYVDFMFHLHSDPIHVIVVAGVLHCLVRATSPREYPTVLLVGLWPHSFCKIMYLYSICLVSTMCCDTTIMKQAQYLQELCALLNTLLLL